MATKATIREDKRFQTTVAVWLAKGGSQRKTIYARTKTELEAKKRHYKREYERGAVMDASKVTFQEVCDAWECGLDRRRGQSTVTATKYRVNKHLIPHLGNKAIQELRAVDLQSILDGLAKGGNYCLDTVKKVRQNAIEIMSHAMGSKILISNPFTSTELPKELSDGYSSDVSQEIADLITDTWRNHRLGIAAMLMLHCGLRRAEAIALTWRDVNLEKRALRINKAVEFIGVTPSVKSPKTEAGKRVLPIPKPLVAALTEYYEMEEARSFDGFVSDMVCPGNDGQLLTLSQFRRGWVNYLNYLNEMLGGYNGHGNVPRKQVLEDFTPHQLRHTYCTRIRRGGAPDWIAKPCMGHSTKKDTTNRYTHATFEDKLKMVDEVYSKTVTDGEGDIKEETLFED